MVFVLRQRHLADGGAAERLGGERGANFLVADFHHELVAGIGRLHGRPLRQQLTLGGTQVGVSLASQVQHGFHGPGLGSVRFPEHAGRFAQLLDFADQPGLAAGPRLVAAHGVADLGQVTGARRRHHGCLVGAVAHGHLRQVRGPYRQTQHSQALQQRLVQGGHAIVIETRRHGAKHRHLRHGRGPGLLVALHLLGHVAQGVERALAVKLVDGHKLGKVEHVDLLQLAGRAKLGRHDIQRYIHMRHDGGIALADPRGLHHHQIKARHLAGRNHIRQRRADLGAKITRGQAAHKNPLPRRQRSGRRGGNAIHRRAAPRWISPLGGQRSTRSGKRGGHNPAAGPPQGGVSPLGGQRSTRSGKRGGPNPNRVHADAVAQQGATAFAAAGVNADHCHA